MYIQRISAESVTVAGTGSLASSTVAVPASFSPQDGTIYDIALRTQIPAETAGTIVTVTNGTLSADVLNALGNYARPRRGLAGGAVLRVQFLSDPDHFNLLDARGLP